ncbi:MAG: hypothetical protein NZ958_00060 [Bacteroidia bacterium]|nr:hypothetical protein [Bacteroidia bacterium]MDW8088214.1 hypothetical protein [Bacteroidia bacterium]
MRWLLLVGSSLLISCTHRLPELEEIQEIREELQKNLRNYGPKSNNFMNSALRLVRAEAAFVRKYPNHREVPRFLLEMAQIEATYFGDVRRAVELLRQIDERFRQRSPIAPQALFYEAFLYETMLADTGTARMRYEAFLRYYPQHELASDARRSLEYLGQPPAEILQRFRP